MRVVALLAIRNEELYIERCLQHLRSQGIETCVIDNGSTDRSVEIARGFEGRGVMRIEHLPFKGYSDWTEILRSKERLAGEIDADWFIHHDADEIREAPRPYKTLVEGIEDADRQGYNAINFKEFVFLPTGDEESYEGTDYVREMRHYYFFEPKPLRRINAWKNTGVPVGISSSGGHKAIFEGRKVSPVQFILRHYIVLSRTHAIAKYAGRVYSAEDLARGANGSRAMFKADKLNFPSVKRLKELSLDGSWDSSDPWRRHTFLKGAPGTGKYARGKRLLKRFLPRRVKDELRRGRLPSLPAAIPADDANRPPAPFIVGAPRSGTTLLRLMLDAHPELAIPPETYFIPRMLELGTVPLLLRTRFYRKLLDDIRWKDFHLDPERLRGALKEIEPFTLPEGLRCFYRLYAERFGKPRWGDKTPRYSLHLNTIQSALPEARFIHIIRDGRDVALSSKSLQISPGDDAVMQAAFWLRYLREARQQAGFCRHYMEVRYEELLTDTTAVLKRVCDFIELPYSPEMEDYHASAGERLDELADRYTAEGKFFPKEEQLKIFSLTSSPPDPSRIGVWKKEMSEEDRQRFEAVAGGMLRDLGYET
ncbi:MAG: sulfotransferase [Thermodesulfobacteriota bacterium]